MDSYTTLKVVHLVGVFALFTSFGAVLSGNSCKKCTSILHGVSLLLILIVGFALLKKPPMALHWWKIKLALWLFLGAAPVLVKRNVLPRGVVLVLCLAAAAAAAYLGLTRSF